MARPKRVFTDEMMKSCKMSLWQRIKVWFNPAKTHVGVDLSTNRDKSCYCYGKFIKGVLYVTKLEYK